MFEAFEAVETFLDKPYIFQSILEALIFMIGLFLGILLQKCKGCDV